MAVSAASEALAGDIRCLATANVEGEELILAGCGPFLHIYSSQGTRLLCCQVFSGVRIHGISSMPGSSSSSGDSSAGGSTCSALLWAEKQVQVISLAPGNSGGAAAGGTPVRIAAALSLPALDHWAMHALLIPAPWQQHGRHKVQVASHATRGAAATPPPAAAAAPAAPGRPGAGAAGSWLAAVGLIDNSVEVWMLPAQQEWRPYAPLVQPAGGAALPAAPAASGAPAAHGAGAAACGQPSSSTIRLLRVACSARVILYSMHLAVRSAAGSSGGHGQQLPSIWVAAGTIFKDVLVWSVPLGSHLAAELSQRLVLPADDVGRAAMARLAADSALVPPLGEGSAAGHASLAAEAERAAQLGGSGTAAERACLAAAAAATLASLVDGDGSAVRARLAAAVEGSLSAQGQEVEAAPQLVLRGHEGSVHCVQWAADGSRVVTGSDDRTLRLWDVSAAASSTDGGPIVCAPQLTLWGHSARLWACAAAGQLLVSCSEDCTVRLWDAGTGRQLQVLRGHSGRGVWCCCLAAAGQLLLTGGAEGSVKLWQLPQLPPLPLDPAAATAGSIAERTSRSGAAGAAAGGSCTSSHQAPDASTSFVVRHMPRQVLTGLTPATSQADAGRADEQLPAVKAMRAVGPATLLVLTQQGSLLLLQLMQQPDSQLHAWQRLGSCPAEAGPPCCMALLPEPYPWTATAAAVPAAASTAGAAAAGAAEAPAAEPQWVAVGHSSGLIALFSLPDKMVTGHDAGTAEVPLQQPPTCWQAHEGAVRFLQAASFSGQPVLLSAGRAPELRLWALPSSCAAAAAGSAADAAAPGATSPVRDLDPTPPPQLAAAAVLPEPQPAGVQVTAAGIDATDSALMVGLHTGDVLVYALPPHLLRQGRQPHEPAATAQLQLLAVQAQVHGKLNAVASVVALPNGGLVSNGKDGTLATWKLLHPGAQPAAAGPEGGGQLQQQLLLRAGVERAQQLTVVAFREQYSSSGGGSCGAGSARASSRGSSGLQLMAGFKGANFVVCSESSGAELMRVACGGCNRPYGFWLAADKLLFACWARQSGLHVHRCRLQASRARPHTSSSEGGGRSSSGGGGGASSGSGGGPAATAAVASLHVVHHGREALCTKLLRLPRAFATQGAEGSQLAMLTGSEDGTVRQLSATLAVAGAVAPPAGAFDHSASFDRVSMALAVKSMDAVAISPTGEAEDAWLVLAGCSRGVLLVWQCGWAASAAGAGGPSLWQTLLCCREPSRGLRPDEQAQAEHRSRAELRVMAAVICGADLCQGAPDGSARGDAAASGAGAQPGGPQRLQGVVRIVAAGSDASLVLLQLALPTCEWRQLAVLEHHASPVLSMAAAGRRVGGGGPGAAGLLLTGSTSGEVAAWQLDQLLSACGGASSSSCGGGGGQQAAAVVVRPAAVLPGVHQSGVNALAAQLLPACSDGGCSHARVLLVTGGDDQALAVHVLALVPAGAQLPGSCPLAAAVQCTGQRRVDAAHGSAIRGLALLPSSTAGAWLAVSVGLDARMRLWRVGCDSEGEPPRLALLGSAATHVLEPAALHALALEDGSSESSGGSSRVAVAVAVAGRGAELVLLAAPC